MTLKENAVYISLIVTDMQQFAILNKVYAARFGLKPPVRVCVQALAVGKMGMGVFACSKNTIKLNLHVQSFSKWAPANIGPYSQANLIKHNGIVFLAG